ncbi:MAG: AAA family ATPase, partial [Prevotella sp.]|nr:AAA family ATPase [Prevotella sp.]
MFTNKIRPRQCNTDHRRKTSDAAKRPNPKSLWHNLWFADEVGCLFADTNVGKSILAVQLAEEIGSQYK